MLTMQRQPSINHHAPLGMNIKSAMAANLGSSLFLFQGLHRISPYLLGEASSSSSPSKHESTPSPSYFRFELQCTSCRQHSCPIALDYNSRVRIGYSSSSPSSSRPSRSKKQARESSDGVQVLRLDLCSYSRKVSLTREIVSRWIGVSYTEGDVSGSKPKEVDFDGLMGELEGAGVEFGFGEKGERQGEEEEVVMAGYGNGNGGSRGGHGRYPSSSASSASSGWY